jgi:hypothetical protein
VEKCCVAAKEMSLVEYKQAKQNVDDYIFTASEKPQKKASMNNKCLTLNKLKPINL